MPADIRIKRDPCVQHSALTQGQKKYMSSICSIYSTDQMKKLVQDQYLKQLFHEAEKGIVRADDLYKYLRYIGDSSKRKHLFRAPPVHARNKHKRSSQSNCVQVINKPLPVLPLYVREEIDKFTRSSTPPPPPRYVSKKRRKKLNK